MYEIWEALQLDGIEMSYGQFRTYVWRIRKKGVPAAVSATASASVPVPASNAESEQPRVALSSGSTVSIRDPLANIREGVKKRDSFDYRPELADPKKLI
jgi:hypothetical protein